MASTVIAGKPSNTVGDKDSTLVLRGSSVKYQWGNKFIDLIKNGKINVDSEKILKIANSIEEVKSDGVYLIKDSIWAVIGGTKIQLTGDSTTTYVSYLIEQRDITPEQKNRALTNIGFYYNTLEEAKEADLKSGLIYVQGDNKLYVIKDGVLTEYITNNSEIKKEDEVIKKLYISEYSLMVDGEEYITCDNNTIVAHKQFILQDGLYSQGASSSYGYQLYIKNGKSYLDIDYVNQRFPKELETIFPDTIYSKTNNIIKNLEIGDNDQVICNLQYTSTFKVNDFVYVMLPIIIEDIWENNTLTISIPFDATKDIIITTSEGDAIIKKGENSVTLVNCPEDYEILTQPHKQLRNYKVIDASFNSIILEVPEREQSLFVNNAKFIYLVEQPLTVIEDNNIYIFDNQTTFEKEGKEYKKYHTKLGELGIYNQETFIYEEPINTQLKQLEEVIEESKRSELGIYSDNFVGLNPLLYNAIFKSAGSLDKDTEHYKFPKYSEELKIPNKDDKTIIDKKFNQIIPNIEWIKQMIDLFIPVGTIIMFNGQSEIPPGWVICNKENSELYDNVPDLTGKFIKSDIKLGPNEVDKDLDEDNNLSLTLSESNLPEHHHPHQKHRHGPGDLSGIAKDSGDLTMPLVYEDYLWDLQFSQTKTDVIAPPPSGDNISSTPTTSVVSDVSVSARLQGGYTEGGNHIHSVDITNGNTEYATSQEVANQSWANNPLKFKIEPHAYSLIFIIKVQPFAEFFVEKE